MRSRSIPRLPVAESPQLRVSVQSARFDPGHLQATLQAGAAHGAVATFTGYVRDSHDAVAVTAIQLEHYPGMTEKSILETLEEAARRWPILAATVVHRVGELAAGEGIVWVGGSAAHRAAAFSACEFTMDYLKTRAPFWKKEIGPDGQRWVEARDADTERARRWSAGHKA